MLVTLGRFHIFQKRLGMKDILFHNASSICGVIYWNSVPVFLIYFFQSLGGQHKILTTTLSTGVPSISRSVSYLKTYLFISPFKGIIDNFSYTVKDIHKRMGKIAWQIKTLSGIRETLSPSLSNDEIYLTAASLEELAMSASIQGMDNLVEPQI